MPEVIINGPEGRLEGKYLQGREENAPIALVLHPHPQHGGTMNNKVVYNLFHVFHKCGFSVLRFNFRGVGRSQGSYAKGEGELSDAAAALDWLQRKNPNSKYCWIGGFSFGAWIALQLLMRRPDINGFITISPPSNLYDFSFLAPCPSSGLILQGSADTIVPAQSQEGLLEKLSSQRGIEVSYEVIEGADHFFNQHMHELQRITTLYLNEKKRALANKGDDVISFLGLGEASDDGEDMINFDEEFDGDDEDEDDDKTESAEWDVL